MLELAAPQGLGSAATSAVIEREIMVPSPMRCMLCNAEMTLIAAVKDESLMASGFERHVYMCSECGDTERRFVFNKSDKSGRAGSRPERRSRAYRLDAGT